MDKKYDIYEIFMGEYWFESVTTDKSTRSGGGRFKVIVNMLHSIYPKSELKSIIQPLPGVTHAVMDLMG